MEDHAPVAGIPALVSPEGGSTAASETKTRGHLPGPVFLHIPVTRLVIMSLVSAGLYEAYWIYKNWLYVRERDGYRIRPFWRGIFGVFFVSGILQLIREDEELNKVEAAVFPARLLAAGWILLVLAGAILGSGDEAGAILLGMAISLPTFLFLVPVQHYINRANAKMNPPRPRTPWSAGHTVCVIVGVLSWLSVLTLVRELCMSGG